MKRISIIFFLFFPALSFSQEINFSSNVGYATGETKTLKKIMLCTDVNFGYEFESHKSLYLLTSIGVSKISFGYTDSLTTAAFNAKYFLNVPVLVRKYFFLSARAKYYLEAGIIGDYFFFDKKEIKNEKNETRTKHNLGYTIGMNISIGYKIAVNSMFDFAVAINGQTDYFFKYKNSDDKIKTDKRLLAISFYKKLK